MKKVMVWSVCVLIMIFSFGCVPKSHLDIVNKEYLAEINAEKKAYRQSQKENKVLREEVENLKTILTNKEKIIDIQQTAIRLFDDSQKTLQSNIQEELAKESLDLPQ